MKTNRIVGGALAALASALLFAAPSGAATTPTGVGAIGLAPAISSPASQLSSSHTWFRPFVAPGETVVLYATVRNSSPTATVLSAYPVNGVESSGGAAVYANQGQALGSGPGSWLTLSTTSIALAAHSSARFSVTVHVPTNAKPGEHLAGVVVQSPAETTTTVTSSSKRSSLAVRLVPRNVLAVDVRVPGKASFGLAKLGKPALQLGPDSVGQIVLPVTAKSPGLIGYPKMTATISSPTLKARSLTAPGSSVLIPGGVARLPLDLPFALRPGLYSLRACLTGGGLAHAQCSSSVVHFTTRSRSTAQAEHQIVVQSAPSGLPSWVLAVGAALLVLIVLLGVKAFRPRRRGPTGESDIHEAGEGEADDETEAAA